MSSSANTQKGQSGEQLAATYFEERGYEILHRNWRHRHFEIDIIAHKNNMLHIIEVKFRSTIKYGFPEQSISRKKIKNLVDASEEFLFRNPEWKRIQFDILSINFVTGGSTEYFLIEDVYL